MLVGRPQTWTAGELLQLVRANPAVSRADLARQTGLSPTTVAGRIEGLLDHGYLVQDSESTTGGRKPRALTVNPDWGVAIAVHIGARHTRVAIADMVGTLKWVREYDIAASNDVEEYLAWLEHQMHGALDGVAAESGQSLPLRGIGLSIPSPVDVVGGHLVAPTHMSAWNRVSLVPRFEESFDVPVVVDNDATLMARGEHSVHRSEVHDMLYIKIGSAIGCGIIVEGSVYRGSTGGAGEIGHLPIETKYARRCVCGRDNCLEACLGGAAIIEHLRARGRDISTTAELVELVERNDPDALELVRASGTAIGHALGALADFFNPELIVLGGRLSAVDALTQALRSALYARSLPLSTRSLTIANSNTRENASTLGAVWTIIDLLLSAERVNSVVQLGEYDSEPTAIVG